MLRWRAVALALALLGAAAAGLSGQTYSYALTPSATIALPPVTGGGVRDLDFGIVTWGGTADTGAGSEAATSTAKWEFNGLKKNRTVQLSFDLPATLVMGVSSLSVSWNNAGYGSWCSRLDTDPVGLCGGGSTTTGTFNPQSANGGLSVNATTSGGASNNNRLLTVWVGGKLLTVPPASPPGLYTATLRLTIVY